MGKKLLLRVGCVPTSKRQQKVSSTDSLEVLCLVMLCLGFSFPFLFKKFHFSFYFLNVYLRIYSLLPYRSFIVFWDSWMYERVNLWVYTCFLCLLLGSFPYVELFCPISMCSFLLYLIMIYSLQTFLMRDRKGVGLYGGQRRGNERSWGRVYFVINITWWKCILNKRKGAV